MLSSRNIIVNLYNKEAATCTKKNGLRTHNKPNAGYFITKKNCYNLNRKISLNPQLKLPRYLIIPSLQKFYCIFLIKRIKKTA